MATPHPVAVGLIWVPGEVEWGNLALLVCHLKRALKEMLEWRCISELLLRNKVLETQQLQPTHLSSQFLYVRNPGPTSLGAPFQGLSRGCNFGVSRESSLD